MYFRSKCNEGKFAPVFKIFFFAKCHGTLRFAVSRYAWHTYLLSEHSEREQYWIRVR